MVNGSRQAFLSLFGQCYNILKPFVHSRVFKRVGPFVQDRKTATIGSTTTQRECVGGIEYSKVGTGASSIEMIHTKEGYLQRSGTSYIYHYNLMDHLGNVRATLQRATATTGTVAQKHDYYPFGKAKALVTSGINKYLYNGKELQGELGEQYDYSFFNLFLWALMSSPD